MRTASVKEIKDELKHRSQSELLELCLSLSKFKKENKEFMTYLLFEGLHEPTYIENIKEEIEQGFASMNTSRYYFIRKSARKILRDTKKYIRYSKKKETEVELLLFYCIQLKNMTPSYARNTTLVNLFERQIGLVKKGITQLHEDLQYDFNIELEELLR